MDAVKTLRALWAKRLVVLLVTALAVGASVALTVTTPERSPGVAQSLALVDTPSSQVVDLGGLADVASIATLTTRANLLTGLVTSAPLKNYIALRAGIAPGALLALSAATQPTAGPGASSSPAPGPNTSPAPTKLMPYVLTASVPELQTGQVPILMIDTQGPTAAGAARLANSAITVLTAYLHSLAKNDNVPASRRVIVRQLGAATSSTNTQGASKIVSVGAGLAIFLIGCGLILVIPAMRSGWRRAGELEKLGHDPGRGDNDSPAEAEWSPMPLTPDGSHTRKYLDALPKMVASAVAAGVSAGTPTHASDAADAVADDGSEEGGDPGARADRSTGPDEDREPEGDVFAFETEIVRDVPLTAQPPVDEASEQDGERDASPTAGQSENGRGSREARSRRRLVVRRSSQ
jgi:hypothetical protein